jgi:hypothetical protein
VKPAILKEGKTVQLSKFAKLLNYKTAGSREFRKVLGLMVENGLVKIQQGGFLGDSMHHPKLVVIRKPLEIDHFRRIVLLQRNYRLGDFSVHVTGKERVCSKCHEKIRTCERYGVKVLLRRRRWSGRVRVYAQEILCFSCLIEKISFDDLESLITRGASADFSE